MFSLRTYVLLRLLGKSVSSRHPKTFSRINENVFECTCLEVFVFLIRWFAVLYSMKIFAYFLNFQVCWRFWCTHNNNSNPILYFSILNILFLIKFIWYLYSNFKIFHDFLKVPIPPKMRTFLWISKFIRETSAI